jgi:hypothetical protein
MSDVGGKAEKSRQQYPKPIDELNKLQSRAVWSYRHSRVRPVPLLCIHASKNERSVGATSTRVQEIRGRKVSAGRGLRQQH